jgi:hypothetical protein
MNLDMQQVDSTASVATMFEHMKLGSQWLSGACILTPYWLKFDHFLLLGLLAAIYFISSAIMYDFKFTEHRMYKSFLKPGVLC